MRPLDHLSFLTLSWIGKSWLLLGQFVFEKRNPFILFWLFQSWPWGYTNRCFLFALCHPNNETELGSRGKKASLSASKNTELVLMLYRTWKCVPTAISGDDGYLGVICVIFSVGIAKITLRITIMNHSLPFCFLPLFDSMKWP